MYIALIAHQVTAKNFIKSLLNPDPVKRPTTAQALTDTVSKHFNFPRTMLMASSG